MLSLCSNVSLAQRPAPPFEAAPPPSFFFPSAPVPSKLPLRVHRYSRRVEAGRRMARLLNPFASLFAAHPPMARQHGNAFLHPFGAHPRANHSAAAGQFTAFDATVVTNHDDPYDPWWPWDDPVGIGGDPSSPGCDPGPIAGPVGGHPSHGIQIIPVYGPNYDPNNPFLPHPPPHSGHWIYIPGPIPGFPGASGIWAPMPSGPVNAHYINWITSVGSVGTGVTGVGGSGGGGTAGGGTGGSGTGGGTGGSSGTGGNSGTGGGNGGGGGSGTGGGSGGGGGSASDFSFYVEWPCSITGEYPFADALRGPIAGVSTLYVVPDDPADPGGGYAIDIYDPSGKLSRHLTNLTNEGDALSQVWRTADFGECNGTYRVVVTKTLTGGGSIKHESTFDVKNLVVTSAAASGASADGNDAGVLRYDPDAATPVAINVKVDAAYEAGQVIAWATLYSADHKTTQEVAYQVLDSVCGAKGTAVFALDAQGALDYAGLPKGIYFYCVHTYSLGTMQRIKSQGVDYDDDKTIAPVLRVAKLDTKATNDDGTYINYDVTYNFTGSVLAKKARLSFYNDDNVLQYSTDVEASAGNHTVPLQLPSLSSGCLVMQAEDDTNLYDKNGGCRQAQRRGTPIFTGAVIGIAYKQLTNHVTYFGNTMDSLHYRKVPGYDWTQIAPDVRNVRETLEYDEPKGSRKKILKVVMYSGHGTKDGMVLAVDGPASLGPFDDPHAKLAPDSRVLLVPTRAYFNAHPYAQKQKCLILDNIQPRDNKGLTFPNALSNLDLVILDGCSQVQGGLGDQFRAMGAKCVVSIRTDAQNDNLVASFLDGPPKDPGTGFLSMLKTMSVKVALEQALAKAIENAGSTGEIGAIGIDGIDAQVKFGPGFGDFRIDAHNSPVPNLP